MPTFISPAAIRFPFILFPRFSSGAEAYRCRSEVRCHNGGKLRRAAGGEVCIVAPASLPASLHDRNSGCTLIIPSLKLFTFSFFAPIFFSLPSTPPSPPPLKHSLLFKCFQSPLWKCVAELLTTTSSTMSGLSQDDFYADFNRRSIHLHYLRFYSLSSLRLVTYESFQCKMRLLTKFQRSTQRWFSHYYYSRLSFESLFLNFTPVCIPLSFWDTPRQDASRCQIYFYKGR